MLLAAVVLILGGALGATHSAKAFDPTKAPEIQDRLLDGLADFELTPSGDATASKPLDNFVAQHNDGCGSHDANNIKVNQNCLNISDTSLQGRGQAQNETSIAINPQDKSQIVASYNDYRRGDGTCGSSFSGNGGQSWSDSTVPNGFTSGALYGAARQYWQAGGDTSVAFDTQGNVYMACQMFMRGAAGVTSNPDLSSAFFVFRSTGNGGASWNFPGRPVVQSPAVNGSDQPFLDKEYLTVDDHTGSPFQDRVYVSWTTFATDGTAYIYEAYSSDYGETFSAPVLVSHDSALCGNSYSLPTPQGRCNENQFSDPFTGPDGALYVAYANFNNAVTGSDNRNQILLEKSTNGGVSFGAPVKVGDYYDLPDCNTYQGAGADPGRACVPEKASTSHSVFRATNLPSGAVNPTNPSQVVVNYGSYINKYSNETQAHPCTPAGFAANGNNKFTGVKTPGACNNKILVSVSSNGGTSFNGGASNADPRTQTTVNTSQQAGTDQWWQWTAFSADGKLAVSYYDRSYGDDETTGNMDFSISGSKDMSTFGTARVTNASMPPPTQFSGQFFGDYTGLDVSDQAHPLWMDTRDPDLFLCPGSGPPQVCQGTEGGGLQAGLIANDEDIFTTGVPIPTAGSSGH
jgi:hypothetical protein